MRVMYGYLASPRTKEGELVIELLEEFSVIVPDLVFNLDGQI